MSHILAARQMQIEELQSEYQRERSDSEKAAHRAAIVQRIRDFFGLGVKHGQQ